MKHFFGKAAWAALVLLTLLPSMKINGQTSITSLSQITDYQGYYVISQDINASGFTSMANFSGTLEGGVKSDGTFYTITGLTQPLFVRTENAILRNLVLDEVSISQSGNVGALVMTAAGNTRVYNCGILSGSVGSTDGYCGGLVGYLADKSRVVNCYSFAEITGGTTVAGVVGYNSFASTDFSNDKQLTLPQLNTIVMNCMFYGDITGGGSRYPVYGGEKISNIGNGASSNNDYAAGINNYNYYRNESSLGTLTDYNCSWPAEEKNLTRFEYYRSILNSNRELASWYISDTDPNKNSAKDTTLIAKWVLDPSIKPYPILKKWGKYPSIVNPDPQMVLDENNQWTNRSAAADYRGKALGTLQVTVKAGEHNATAANQTLNLTITDMDTLHYDYGYAKVQLPYYNELFGDPSSTDHATRYGNNYTDWAVTGWKITAVNGGSAGSFTEDWESGYNFADRYCTQKDLYDVSKRVFAQGGYYYVPEGVNAITIEAYWGKAVYISSNEYRFDIVTNKPFRGPGTRPNKLFSDQTETVKTTFKTALQVFENDGRIEANGMTVYDNAVILFGNYQLVGGKKNDDLGYSSNNNQKIPYTIMSLDLDFDNEPDYCLVLQKGEKTTRYRVNPIRFDFVPYVRMGMAMKQDGTLHTYGIGICLLKGHFEMTETAFADFGQFEYDDRTDFGTKTEAPLILNGGSVNQIVTSENAVPNNLTAKTSYIILGGHLYMKAFNPGPHNTRTYKNRHCVVNVIGGDIDQLTLSGCYNAAAQVHADNPHCYMNGGKLKLVAGAGQEKIDGDVTFKIDHSVIKEFYGGGINASNPITGNIDVTIDHSLVEKYCGGPMFGDVAVGKTVTTHATGTTFGVFYGAGNGGTNYRLAQASDNHGGITWISNSDWHLTEYHSNQYDTDNHDYAAKYEFELMNGDAGDIDGISVCRFYRYNAQFAVTATRDVSSTLTDCVVKTDFYGGGNLGGVHGDVTSELKNTHVLGSAYGGGFSAAIPSFDVYMDLDQDPSITPPQRNEITNIITPAVYGGRTHYTWTNETSLGGQTLSTSNPTVTVDGVNYFYTEKSLENLGSVSGNTSIIVDGTSVIEGNLFGAGNESEVLSNTNAVVDDDAWVKGSVYGGGNVANTNGNTQVQMKNGIVGVVDSEDVSTGNLYGGGRGTKTDLELAHVGGNTTVVVSGGTVVRNVYGGGELGKVLGKTDVMLINGATLNNVFGAGKGDAESEERSNANVSQGTNVTLVNGQVKGSIYGGGENGSVGIGSSKDNTEGASVININGGKVFGSVFGGGSMGYTEGNTIVNLSGDGVVNQHVFGGAFGSRGKVYVAGLRMVNMRGGNVYNNVYGGSRNADDAMDFEPGDFDQSTDQTLVSVVNISGGHVYKQVFASGYFGNVYGSTSVYIGTNAIMNAPNHSANPEGTYNEAFFTDHKALVLDGSVWAGGDFGNFDGYTFGDPTISGRSDVYLDGTGYAMDTITPSTDDGYINIDGSLYGCGTSCDAGKQGRRVMVRNYGLLLANEDYEKEGYVEPYAMASRSLYSIQRADSLIFDGAHVNFLGHGLVNSLITTEKYSIHEFDDIVRMVNGSSLFLRMPVEQIEKLGFYTCENVYTNPVYTVVSNESLPAGHHDNKIRVHDGSYVAVKYDNIYGELDGFAYIMTDAFNNTLAYARPKQSNETGNRIPNNYDNPSDGGFVSYLADYNMYTLDGTLVSGGYQDQLRYENHTPDMREDSPYFRVWRYGDIYSRRDGVFNVIAQNEDGYSTVDVVIDLPASGGAGTYYRIKSFEGVPTIDYGTDVQTVNAGCYGLADASDWMYYHQDLVDSENSEFVYGLAIDHDSIAQNLDQIRIMPNNTFGLVAIPQGSLAGGDNANLLFYHYADELLIGETWENNDNTLNPSVLFRLSYYNKISGNFSWEPITIVFEQVKDNGDGTVTIIDDVTVSLVINTSTSIEQDITAQAFALMRGQGLSTDTYTTKVMVPPYLLQMTELGELSRWYLTNVKWTKRDPDPELGETEELSYAFVADHEYVGSTEQFGMTLEPSLNMDNSTGWSNNISLISALDSYEYYNNETTGEKEPYYLGETDGRFSVAFDFILNFDGSHFATNDFMGVLEFDMYFTNYREGDPTQEYRHDFKVFVEVYRRGNGARFYIDGVHGSNAYSGRFPNAAKKTLAGILHFTAFQPGDEIYIVNTVTANSNSTLEWNGQAYNHLTMYRYPGGHDLYTGVDHQQYWVDYDVENNPAFKGALIKVTKSMNISAITLDGSSLEHASEGYPTDPAVESTSAMITVAKNATLKIYGNSILQHNFNNSTSSSAASNGGAIYLAAGGKLYVHDDTQIIDNAIGSRNGAGVYVADGGDMIVSDKVTIIDNLKDGAQNNVRLIGYDNAMQVGTRNPNDSYMGLDASSKIGVTKIAWNDQYYTPVLYSDEGMDFLDNLARKTIVFDDQAVYAIEKLEPVDPDNHLYFVKTWTNVQRVEPDGFDASDINTPQELAWAISLVNGLNGATAQPDLDLTLTGDIDMDAQIWDVIGEEEHPYSGHFNGNGYSISGIHSLLTRENMGLFGKTVDADISNMIVTAAFEGGTDNYMGAVIGTMSGGTLSNVEASGTLHAKEGTIAMGGLVGNTESGLIHSSFAVDSLYGMTSTVVGGLVGVNASNLYNSYSNVQTQDSEKTGGLVGTNNGFVENCYVVLGSQTCPAFAYENNETIQYCYAEHEENGWVSYGRDPSSYGIYEPVADRHAYGYMYDDNKVDSPNNRYVASTISYANKQIDQWPGLLSALNQWVKANSDADLSYTSWLRPTSSDINGDLPVLTFGTGNCLGTMNGKFLQYSVTSESDNGLDALLTQYNGKSANIFLYDNAVAVAEVPTQNVNVFINEDVALKQASTAGKFINATVGVSFDNSHGQATDFFGNTLAYDWHMLSTPLADAPLGITYNNDSINPWTMDSQAIQLTNVSNSYMPDGTDYVANWDLYSFYEPEYHWINLKRNSASHHHYDDPYNHIVYTNETTFTPGKGYMAAIDMDSYLLNSGTLNGPSNPVSITLTKKSHDPGTDELGYNLLGNPYQAYLDVNRFLSINGLSSYWVYIAESDNYIAGNADASENPVLPSATLHPHQGFFVLANSDGQTVNFDYDEMALTTPEANSFFRGGKVNYPLVNLFATGENGKKDLTVIEFNRPEFGGSKKMRAINNANFELSAHMGNQRYSILFTEEGIDRVPVHFVTKEEGTFTLTWETYHGTFTSLFLVDNKTGIRTDMLRSDGYTFEGSPDDYASRFYITFKCIGVDEYTDGEGDFAWFDGNDWIVTGQGQLQLVDVLGHVLQSQYLSGDQTRLYLNGYAVGVYMLRLTDGTKSKVQKIIIK